MSMAWIVLRTRHRVDSSEGGGGGGGTRRRRMSGQGDTQEEGHPHACWLPSKVMLSAPCCLWMSGVGRARAGALTLAGLVLCGRHREFGEVCARRFVSWSLSSSVLARRSVACWSWVSWWRWVCGAAAVRPQHSPETFRETTNAHERATTCRPTRATPTPTTHTRDIGEGHHRLITALHTMLDEQKEFQPHELYAPHGTTRRPELVCRHRCRHGGARTRAVKKQRSRRDQHFIGIISDH